MAPHEGNGGRKPRLKLDSDRLLLVEGKDEVNLFGALIRHRFGEGAPGIQLIDAGGKDKFPGNIEAIRIAARARPTLRAIGAVRDADNDAGAAFQSVCAQLQNAGFQPPGQHAGHSVGVPSVGVFIAPDGINKGAIETLCRRSVEGSAIAGCVDQYLGCLEENGALASKSPDKSFAHACLAATEDPVARVGEGARAGAWDLGSEAFDGLAGFLAAILQA
ncbi:MAG: hypothetical protein F4Z60_09720 [Chloroflexi bacterium]|nr:hypothetical protein [Chloroflexota bacterium]